MRYPGVGFTLKVFLVPIIVEMICSVAAEQKSVSFNAMYDF